MEKYIYDENNGLWYELQGNYYIPCLKLLDEEQVEIGVWVQRHLEYIKHHRKGFYTSLVLDSKLTATLQTSTNKQKKCLIHSYHHTKPPKASPNNSKRIIKWSGYHE